MGSSTPCMGFNSKGYGGQPEPVCLSVFLLVIASHEALHHPFRSFRKSRKVPFSASLTLRSCNCHRRYEVMSAFEAQSAAPVIISTIVVINRSSVIKGSVEAANAIPHKKTAGISNNQKSARQNNLRRRKQRFSSVTGRPLVCTASSQLRLLKVSSCVLRINSLIRRIC